MAKQHRSLALRNQEYHRARVAGADVRDANPGPGSIMQGSLYAQMQAALWADRRTLKDIKSIKGKVQAKRAMLPKYAGYVDGILASDSGLQDEVLMHVMLWRFDVGDLAGAMPLAAYALRHQLTTPDRYVRDTASVVVEQTADEVLGWLAAHPESEPWPAELPPVSQLADWCQQALDLTADHDMHDQIRAKAYKALGFTLRRDEQPDRALSALLCAMELHPQVGVKKDIERLERQCAK